MVYLVSSKKNEKRVLKIPLRPFFNAICLLLDKSNHEIPTR